MIKYVYFALIGTKKHTIYARIFIMYDQRTILWYDLETFGLNPRVDRIAQAAAIRTDLVLNIVDDPILLYCKLSDDYLPNPESCILTGITPDEVEEKGIGEYDFIKRLNDEFLVPGTIGCGYNNMGFDDECIRATLYRNLFDPYERENFQGRSRWDIINLVRATRDLRPDGICFEKKNPETGWTSFRLTDLTEENGINQNGAHDALVDVRATIAIAKLIKNRQPRLYSYAFQHRSKNDIWNLLDVERMIPMLHTHPMYASEYGNTHPILPIWRNKKRSNDIWCFDLTKDFSSDIGTSDIKDTGIIRIATNKCPFIAPLSVLDSASEKRLGFTKAEIEEKAAMIRKKQPEIAMLAEKFSSQEFLDGETDPDYTIYERFISDADKAAMKRIAKLDPKEKLESGEHNFEDAKYHKLLWRLVARNWPEALSENGKRQWKNFCASRLINPPSKSSRTIELFLRECQDGIDSIDTDPEKKKIYLSLKNWAQRLEERVLS